MANQERGEVSVEANGRLYTLRPSLNAFCAVEDLTGHSFEEISAQAERGRPKELRALLWAFLQDCHGDEIQTLEDAGRWVMNAGGIAGLTAKFQQLTRLNAGPEEARPAKPNGRPSRAQAGRHGAASTSMPGVTPT
jgi:hypothetical protein